MIQHVFRLVLIGSFLALALIGCKPVQVLTNSAVDSSKKPQTGQKIVTFAEKYIGTPYKTAGTTPSGFDCSGFTLFVFKNMGMELPRKSDEQAKTGKEIPLSQAQKGDLIYFKGSNKNSKAIGHVGIVVSQPGERLKFIHSSTSKGIIYDYLDVKYFQERFVMIRRNF